MAFNRMFAGLAAEGGPPDQLMIDATHLKAYRRTKDDLNSNLHAICDERGRPCVMLLTEGQVSDYKGAAFMFDSVPHAPVLIVDPGYAADWLRHALRARGTRASQAERTAPRDPPRQENLRRPASHRDHVRQAQGLVAHRHPLQ